MHLIPLGEPGLPQPPDTCVVRPRLIGDRSCGPHAVVGWGVEVSLRSFLHTQLVQGQLGDGSLQPDILPFQVLESLRRIECEPPILMPLARGGGVGTTPLPTDALDRLPLGEQHFRFAKLVNGVFNGEFHAWHRPLL